ncbi:amidase signature domain-containing protein [Lactarius quietus]|nr:amidase signature domain-containing protein [Lactarius quietus]
MWPFSDAAYRETIESKRARRADALSHAPAFSEDTHQKYLDATAKQIVENIHAGVWTAAAVLEGYLARAAQAQEATNCLTEVFFEQAREEARKLDAEFAKTGELKGLLHGVPISVKDMIDVKGFDSSIGYTQWTNKSAKQDAPLVAALRAAGAIVIAKTNVPQTLLAFESSNPIWGRTLNPWSAAHTAGGSSGGEGALLGADGAVLGVGTDIGGSIRIPSGYCGIYGFKPGHGRISYGGMADSCPGFEAIRAVAGPMARSVADLERMARVLFGAHGGGHAYFPTPIPYRDVKLPEKLRFGYYLNDTSVKGSPACHRAVLESVQALRAAGHECVEIDCPDSIQALLFFCGLTSADGYETIMSPLGSDKREPALFLTTLGTRLPGFVRAAASWVIRTIVGDAKFASIFTQSYKKTVRQLYECVVDKTAFEEQTRANLWSGRLDAIIAPVQASPAVPHGGCDRLAPIACSTLLYNIVESPVGVIPVTRVDATRDVLSDEWRAAPGNGSKLLEDALYGTNGAYDPQAMEGLPVSVQIIGETWGEEKLLAVMHVVDAALGPRGFGPGTWAPNKQTDVAKNTSDNQQ